MATMIVEGMLADIDGVRPGQVRIEDGTIVAVGRWSRDVHARLPGPLSGFCGHGGCSHPRPRGCVGPREAQGDVRHGGGRGGPRRRRSRCRHAQQSRRSGRRRQLRGQAGPGRRRRPGRGLHALRRHRPRDAAAESARAVQGLHGPQRRRPLLPQPRRPRPHGGGLPRLRGQFPLRGPRPAGTAPRGSDARGTPSAGVRTERHTLRTADGGKVWPDGEALPLLGGRGAAADPGRRGHGGCR